MGRDPGDQEAPAAAALSRAAIWHFARGMAQCARTSRPPRRKELRALQAIAADPAMAKVGLWDINHADRVLAVAEPMLRGELALAERQRKTGIAALREAVAAEDKLNYNEPPDWPLPVRPYLGAALARCRARQGSGGGLRGRPEEVPGERLVAVRDWRRRRRSSSRTMRAESERRQAAAWQWADVKLTASRF